MVRTIAQVVFPGIAKPKLEEFAFTFWKLFENYTRQKVLRKIDVFV